MQDELTTKIKAMIARALERGYLAFEELNTAMPPEDYTSEQIKDIAAVLAEKGIVLVDFPSSVLPGEVAADRETICEQSIGRLETVAHALRRGKVRFACQLLEATVAELRPFADD